MAAARSAAAVAAQRRLGACGTHAVTRRRATVPLGDHHGGAPVPPTAHDAARRGEKHGQDPACCFSARTRRLRGRAKRCVLFGPALFMGRRVQSVHAKHKLCLSGSDRIGLDSSTVKQSGRPGQGPGVPRAAGRRPAGRSVPAGKNLRPVGTSFHYVTLTGTVTSHEENSAPEKFGEPCGIHISP